MELIVSYFTGPNIGLIVTYRCSVECELRVFSSSTSVEEECSLLYESVAGSVVQFAPQKSNVPMSALLVGNTAKFEVYIAEQIQNLSLHYLTFVTQDLPCHVPRCHLFCVRSHVRVPIAHAKKLILGVITHNLLYRQPLKHCQVPARDYASHKNSAY